MHFWVVEILVWARNHLAKAVVLGSFALIIYAGYRAVDEFIPEWASTYKTQHADLKRAIASYQKLDEILNRLQKEYNGSRAALFRFHDSSKDLSRMAFYFLSVANIVGVATEPAQLKDIPASTFSTILPSMIKSEIWFGWTKSIPNSPIKDLLIRRGTRAILVAPMKDLDKNLIGILWIEWLSENDIPRITEEMKASLTANATLISGYFSLGQLKDLP